VNEDDLDSFIFCTPGCCELFCEQPSLSEIIRLMKCETRSIQIAPLTKNIKSVLVFGAVLMLSLLALRGNAQFSNYNQTVRELNYYLIYLDHLLSYNEQTTQMLKEMAGIYQKDSSATQTPKSWTSYPKLDVDLRRQRQNVITDALKDNYDATAFKNYNRKSTALPDSVKKLFNGWIKRADSIAATQNNIANNLLSLIVQYNLMPAYEKKNIDRIHALINNYHQHLPELQEIRDSITATALFYYQQERQRETYPFSVYEQGLDDLLQTNIYLNQYFVANQEGNDEAGIIVLRKANEHIEAYLKNEYIYRKNNEALVGYHVFPLNEDVHIQISQSLKEMAFQINRYANNYQEKVDAAYFNTQIVNLINLLNAVSFSHDENVDVRKPSDIPARYHETLKAILRYDFLKYRYDTYRNSLSNKNKAPLPLTWSRYVYRFDYVQPPVDTVASAPEIPEEKKPLETSAEVKKASNVQIIEVFSDSMHLFFYDNGEVDNDTITISINGIVVASNVRLDTSPFELKIGLKPGETSIDLSVSAENLGVIPPNTAFLKVVSGDIVHRLYLFSTKQVDAVVRIVNRKE
jgi:hypothetical protein